MSDPEEILAFWFGETLEDACTLDAFAARTKSWFFRDDALDATIRARFADDVGRAAGGELATWKDSPEGRLALILLLDQFPRNLNRGKKEAFATDREALDLATEGLAAGVDRALSAGQRLVFYLPFMHAEDAALQAKAETLYRALHDGGPEHLRPELAGAVKAAERHRFIIDQFGRFPHRNEALARPTTEEERTFLAGPGSRF